MLKSRGLSVVMIGTTMVGLVVSCTGEDSSPAGTDELSSGSSATTALSEPPLTSAVNAPPPPEFCKAAEQAAEGNIAFSDPAVTAELTEFEGLTEHQRQIITDAVDATRREVERVPGGSWTNNEMVDAVNELCGSDLTPVTLTPG
jgi:hypothetical protein